jgi:hypothetical protein
MITESQSKGGVGYSYNLRCPPGDQNRWTILLRHGECLLGIWSFSRLGMTMEEFAAMTDREFDLWCTITVLRLSSGDLTCP